MHVLGPGAQHLHACAQQPHVTAPCIIPLCTRSPVAGHPPPMRPPSPLPARHRMPPLPALGSAKSGGKKVAMVYVCSHCGHTTPKNLIACPECRQYSMRAEKAPGPQGKGAAASPAVELINQTSSAVRPTASAKTAARPKQQQQSKGQQASGGTAAVVSRPSGGRQGAATRGADDGDEEGAEEEDEEEAEGEDEEDAGPASTSGRTGSWVGRGSSAAGPRPLSVLRRVSPAAAASERAGHIALAGRTGAELGRVLSGTSSPGVVPASFVLVGGDPGIGKSTLMLQLAAMVSDPLLDFDVAAQAAAGAAAAAAGLKAEEQEQGEERGRGAQRHSDGGGRGLRKVLYVTGEEKEMNVFDRAARMGLDSCTSLFILSADCMDDVIKLVAEMQPAVVVVDSIQTMHMREVAGSPGGTSQVKECGQVLRLLCNKLGTTVFLIGHVTKSGEVAGPKMLEHIVDTVLFLEGEAGEGRRLLRVHKNRNGPTDEVGIFRMDARGMHAVENASALFLDDVHGTGKGGEVAAGQRAAVLGVCLMGNRAVMLEVQALCSRAYNLQAPLVRQSTGVSKERFMQLVHVMSKVLPSCRGLNIHHIYCTVVRGAQFKEPAADLAMALAIASSFFDAPLPPRLAVVGEVDLAGKLRSVTRLEQRLAEVAQLGVCETCIVPRSQHGLDQLPVMDARLSGLQLVPCGTLHDALREALGPVVDSAPASASDRGRGGGSAGGLGALAGEEDGFGGAWEGEGEEEEEEEEERGSAGVGAAENPMWRGAG